MGLENAPGYVFCDSGFFRVPLLDFLQDFGFARLSIGMFFQIGRNTCIQVPTIVIEFSRPYGVRLVLIFRILGSKTAISLM
jgi:hypothetical protein